MLINKLRFWNTNQCWSLKPLRSRKDNKVYIENTTENKVLGVVDGQVKLVQDQRGQSWEKGEANQQGYFTLKNPASQKALTTDSEGFLSIEGKDSIILFHFCSLTNPIISYQQIKTHVAYGDCLSL